MRTIVIGLGNAWRRDDGVGPFVTRALRERELAGDVDCADAGDGLALLEAWRDADRAYVIDALRSGAAPGTTVRIDALTEQLPNETHYSSHAFGLADAVALGRSLGRLPPALFIVGIQGRDFGHGSGLSPEVEAAARDVANGLGRELAAHHGAPNRA